MACEQPDVRCRFGDERDLGRTVHRGFHAIAATHHADSTWIAWSEPGGTWLARVGAQRARRVGPACSGGLALAGATGETPAGTEPPFWLACLARSSADKDAPGSVSVWRIAGTEALDVSRTEIATAGRDARGITLLAGAESPELAWQDGVVGRWRVWRKRPNEAAEPVSLPDLVAGPPRLHRDGTRTLVTWAERGLGGDRRHTRIVVQDDAGLPRQLLERVPHTDPAPALVRADGRLWLGYRAHDRRHDRAGLHVVRLSDDLRVEGAPIRVGRADETGPLGLVSCGDALFTVVSRSYGARDILVGINRLDGRAMATMPELQIYQWNAAFVHVDALCSDDGLATFFADRGDSTRRGAAVRMLPLRCE